jgi:hypothetical protein
MSNKYRARNPSLQQIYDFRFNSFVSQICCKDLSTIRHHCHKMIKSIDTFSLKIYCKNVKISCNRTFFQMLITNFRYSASLQIYVDMKSKLTKLGIFIAAFVLVTGLYSQSMVRQASAELRIPDCVGIITICNNQYCSAEASNTKSNSISQELSNSAEIGQTFDISQTVENSTGPSTISLSDFATSIEQSNQADAAISDSSSQESTASTTCTHNE